MNASAASVCDQKLLVYEGLNCECMRAGTPIIMYTKPGQHEQTEMMLVIMTDEYVVLGELNTKRVFSFTFFLLHNLLMPASRRHMK